MFRRSSLRLGWIEKQGRSNDRCHRHEKLIERLQGGCSSTFHLRRSPRSRVLVSLTIPSAPLLPRVTAACRPQGARAVEKGKRRSLVEETAN